MKNRYVFPPEVEQFIINNHKGTTHLQMSKLVLEKFNIDRSKSYLGGFYRKHNLKSGLDGKFEKGSKSWNKGMKQSEFLTPEQIERTKATRFQKGDRPGNYKPIGSERVDKKDGYILIKVQDTGSWPERWRFKHVVEWEKVNGPIPKGHMLTFLDGNKLNVSLDNLLLITKRENAIINKSGLRSEVKELNEIGINLGRLVSKFHEKREGE